MGVMDSIGSLGRLFVVESTTHNLITSSHQIES